MTALPPHFPRLLSVLQRRGWLVLHLEFTAGRTSPSSPALTTCSYSFGAHNLAHLPVCRTFNKRLISCVVTLPRGSLYCKQEAYENWKNHGGESTLHAVHADNRHLPSACVLLAGASSPHLDQEIPFPEVYEDSRIILRGSQPISATAIFWGFFF